MTENKIFGWLHRVNGHEFEQALGDAEGRGSLVGKDKESWHAAVHGVTNCPTQLSN